MTLSQFRGLLYGLAKALGDLQAANKAQRKGSVEPLVRRGARRALGRITGRMLGRIFRGGR